MKEPVRIDDRAEGLYRVLDARSPVPAEVRREIEELRREIDASMRREVITASGEDPVLPNAANNSDGSDGGVFAMFIPEWDCGTAASDDVSANAGNVDVGLLYVDFGGA